MGRWAQIVAFFGVFTAACAGADEVPTGSNDDGGRVVDLGGSPEDAGTEATDLGLDAGLDLGPGEVGTTPDAGPDGGLAITVLTASTTQAGVHFQLLRLVQPGKAPTYAQWFPPPPGTAAPVVVQTQPYDGIDWTPEAVDARWAARGAGLYPDEDGPDYDPARSYSIVYTPLPPARLVADSGLWRFHGFGALYLFGRFYAGGDVANDIDDMVTGLSFLQHTPDVDLARVGIIGGSWGGFLALYGAAYAHPGVQPKVGVALYPVSDFQAERAFVTEVLPTRYTEANSRAASATFFEPYLRRIDATTADRGGFVGLTAPELVARIRGDFLLIHEDWDTLVDFEQSRRLVALAPDHFRPLWILHDGPPHPWDQALTTHGPLLAAFAANGGQTFAWAHLLLGLGGPAQPLYVPFIAADLRALLQHLFGLSRLGVDVAFLAERLQVFCDPRVSTYELNTQTVRPGPETLADELNAGFGTAYDGPSACAQLALGLPP